MASRTIMNENTDFDLNTHNDLEDTSLTARDTSVVQSIMEEGLTVFTFDGLKRLLGLHQEKLSRIIDRLEEEGVVERVSEGYRVTPKGNAIIPRPLNTGQVPMPVVQSLLPSDVDVENLASQLKGRWFGKLRWLGYSKGDDGLILKWIAEEDGFQIDAKFAENYLSIDARLGETSDISQAVKAAHQLLGHISRTYNVPRRKGHLLAPVAFYTEADYA